MKAQVGVYLVLILSLLGCKEEEDVVIYDEVNRAWCVINAFPQTNSGQDWDSDSPGPDIRIFIRDADGLIFGQSQSTQENADQNGLPYALQPGWSHPDPGIAVY